MLINCAFLSVLDICTEDKSSVFHRLFSNVMVHRNHDISIISKGYVEVTFTVTFQVFSSESLLILIF